MRYGSIDFSKRLNGEVQGSDDRMYPGSVELVRIEDQGGGPIRAVIHIPAMPSYIERMLLDKLKKKLRYEYGEPAPPPKKPSGSPDDDHE